MSGGALALTGAYGDAVVIRVVWLAPALMLATACCAAQSALALRRARAPLSRIAALRAAAAAVTAAAAAADAETETLIDSINRA